MSEISELKKLIDEMKQASLLQKGALAEQALDQAVVVLDEHEVRLGLIERYIRGNDGK